jgi:hypothetical protein
MLDSVSRGRSPSPGLSEIRSGNGLTAIGTPAVTSGTDTQVFQLDHRLTWLRGRHAWKTGATWQHYRMQRYFSGNNGVLGQIGFDGSFTGVPFGDCLLDLVSVKGRGSLAEPWTHLQHRVAVYGADNVKVTGALTATIGLRWAFSSPLVETDDRQANVSLTNGQPLLAGRDGNSRALYEPFYGGWEPRVGLAYRPHERWVVRGAYGITQSMEGTGANLRLTLNPPFFFESEARYDRTSGAGTGRDRDSTGCAPSMRSPGKCARGIPSCARSSPNSGTCSWRPWSARARRWRSDPRPATCSNTPSFGPPVANIQSQNFGTITSTVNNPRLVQIVAKYQF